MKKYLTALFACFIGFTGSSIIRAGPAEFGAEVGGLRLGASLKTNSFSQAAGIGLTIIITNGSSHSLSAQNSTPRNYDIKIINEKGDSIPKKKSKTTRLGHRIIVEESSGDLGGDANPLRSGEKKEISTNIRYYFDSIEPGSYKAIVIWAVNLPDSNNADKIIATNLSSQPLSFVITTNAPLQKD